MLGIFQGRSVMVFDVQPEAISRLQHAGADVGHSPAEVAEKSDTIVTMLPTNSHVMQVYAGKAGVLEYDSNYQSIHG